MQSLKMLVRIALVVIASFARAGDPAPAAAAQNAEVVRGKYLVDTSGCHDCHTPFKMTATGPAWDMDRMLSGHPETMEVPAAPQLPPGPWLAIISAPGTAYVGPWGTSFTANLTPDKETGLGKWTARTFIDTIRTGRHLGRGREILPPMPIQVYKNFTDQDLAAIFAYLQTIPAVKNKVPAPRPPVATAAATVPAPRG